jgi:ABC-type nitrate/sulfonate/bicarbonate transport system substrate-binding protein
MGTAGTTGTRERDPMSFYSQAPGATESKRRALFLWLLAVGTLPWLWAPQPTGAQVKSNIASSVTSESAAHIWMAQDRGLLKKYGLEAQFILMPRNPLTVAALIAGEIDTAVIGPGHLFNAALSGSDLIGIANFHQKLDFRLNVRPEIKKPDDLRGKRIAISGPASTSHLVSMLSLQGMNIDPVQARISFLTIPGTEVNRRLALETGGVDATTL